MMQQDLFGFNLPENKDEKEDIHITTTILYMSENELKEFKKLCKIGIKKLFPDTYREEGNYTDLILYLLKKEYSND